MRRIVASLAVLWLVPMAVLASGGEPATALEHHVDTSRLSGTNLMLANLYNDNRVLYALVTTLAMAFFGIAIAFTVDGLLGRLGLKVSKVEHRE
jgi:ABC-type phosphate/phosphonate transport system permease subunit